MSHIFESTTEKLARILARQYGVEVVFEGNVPCTDGKTIFLPSYDKLDDELRTDMNGFLDHEVAHCKFTEMGQIKHCINKLHNMLTQNIEDYRIEKEMIKDFPGCAFNLGPLNEKYRGKMNLDWEKRPWPIRLLTTIRDIVEGRPARIDADYKRYMDVIQDDIEDLRGVTSTKEVREKTQAIIEKIHAEREKEKEENGENGEGEEGDKEEGKDKKKSKGKGKPSEGEGDEEGESGDIDDMLNAKEGSKTAKEMEKFVTSVEGMMEQAFAKKEKEERKAPNRSEYRVDPKAKHPAIVPTSTRFDVVTDHSGKGNAKLYGDLRAAAKKIVAPIKAQLERVLKVKENAKWRTEKERGAVNARGLSQLVANPSYRQIFKEFSKTETNNVAVELLIDLSGSMSGPRIETAKASAVAIAEALKDLGIPFEVTGFCAEYSNELANLSNKMGADATKRFARRNERLDLHVYKSFDCTSLQGISAMRSGGNNPDSEAVAWAAKRLSLRKQKRKVLMVFSDGQPATGDASFGHLQADLRRVINECPKFGIEVIGFGIETEHVKEFYPDYVLLKDVKDLPKQAMTKVAKLLEK